jgi:prolipoprotein diacylglyceryltransferase
MFLHTKKKLKEGFIFWTMMLFFGIGRFFLDFVREDARWLGITAGQHISIVLTVITVIVLGKYYKKEWKKVF